MAVILRHFTQSGIGYTDDSLDRLAFRTNYILNEVKMGNGKTRIVSTTLLTM